MLNRARSTILVWSFWAVLAAPSLCAGGVLAHWCEAHAHNTCGHEDNCSSDPCAAFTSAGASPVWRTGDNDVAPSVLSAPRPDAFDNDAALPFRPELGPFPEPLRAPSPGDRLPLLI